MSPDRWLSAWAFCAGLALFVPAIGIPVGDLPLQPLDILTCAGVPLILAHWRSVPPGAALVISLLVASFGLSFALADGQVFVLIHGIALIVPFVVLMALVAASAKARKRLVTAVVLAGTASALLFLAQMLVGAEGLDFRTNTGFSLPPQYGRGFALFPEVSTLAVHLILTLAILLGVVTQPGALRQNPHLLAVTALIVVALVLTRSTSFLVLAPPLCTLSLAWVRPIRLATLLRLLLFGMAAAALLFVFYTGFYEDRLSSASASRSAQMRLSSILAGLSPLWSGELFGVGLGQNHEISRRAYDISRLLDLRFGQLPTGVNSQIVARIFEEGWPAMLGYAAGLGLLLRAARLRRSDPIVTALLILSVGSLLMAGLVTGYRAIYTNLLWLALPAGLLSAQQPVRRRTAPTVRTRILRSSVRQAFRA